MLAEEIRRPPTSFEVFQKGLRLELCKNIDGEDAGVDEVGEHKIDDPISAAERHGRLRPMLGQWIKALAFSTCEDDAKYIHGKLCVSPILRQKPDPVVSL